MLKLGSFELSNTVAGGGVGVLILVVFVIIWWKSKQGGRIGLEKQMITEDREILEDDRKILKTARDQKIKAGLLLNSMRKLDVKLQEIRYEVTQEQKKQFAFVIGGLQLLKIEGEGVLKDKQIFLEINAAINSYINLLPNDPRVSSIVQNIKDYQKKLFGDILTEEELIRQKFILLRKDAQQTIEEEKKAA